MWDISHNAKGQIKTITYGNDITTTYTYGQDLRAAIDTASVGNKSFKVIATDKADNQKEQGVSYKVIYRFTGIQAPIKADGSSVFKLGSTIPIRFQLKNAQGNFVNSAVAKLNIQKCSNNESWGDPIEAISTANATTGNLFKYDSNENQYIFNLATKALTTGAWQLQVALDDGSNYAIIVGLK